MADLQTSTWSETAASNNASAPDGWPEGQTVASLNNCAREMMGSLKREWNRSHNTVTSGGTSTALTLTYTTAPPAYVRGMQFAFRVGTTTGAAATLNVNSLGAKALRRSTGAGTAALESGALVANSLALVQYDDNADAMVLLSINSKTVQLDANGDINNGTAGVLGKNTAKAWGLFNGSSLVSSYGISTITDHGVGDVTFNFTTAFTSGTSYIAVGTASCLASDGEIITFQPRTDTSQKGASSCRFNSAYSQAGVRTLLDVSEMAAAFWGT